MTALTKDSQVSRGRGLSISIGHFTSVRPFVPSVDVGYKQISVQQHLKAIAWCPSLHKAKVVAISQPLVGGNRGSLRVADDGDVTAHRCWQWGVHRLLVERRLEICWQKTAFSHQRVPLWALKSHLPNFIATSFRSDHHHVLLCWLGECTKAWFHHSKKCSLPLWLQVTSLIINKHVPLLILKVLFRFHQTFPLLLCFTPRAKHGSYSSGFLRRLLSVMFGLAEAANVIGSPIQENLNNHKKLHKPITMTQFCSLLTHDFWRTNARDERPWYASTNFWAILVQCIQLNKTYLTQTFVLEYKEIKLL